MKRLFYISLLGAVALVASLADAQVRGGFIGGRGVSVSRVPVRSGPAFAPRVNPGFFASRPVAGRPIVSGRQVALRATPSRVFFTTVPFHHPFFPFFNCFGGFPCPHNGFFLGSNFGFGSPFFGSNFGFGGSPFFSSLPFYGGDLNTASEPVAPPPQVVSSDNGASVELARELQSLSDQISDLRSEETRRASAERPAGPQGALSVRAPDGVTTFVLRDGRHIVAQNYALTGQTLWVFDEHKARKIALSDIDRAATEQLNAANGIDIRIP